jgi:hypothetical protein
MCNEVNPHKIQIVRFRIGTGMITSATSAVSAVKIFGVLGVSTMNRYIGC